jgi:hypothetical protein
MLIIAVAYLYVIAMIAVAYIVAGKAAFGIIVLLFCGIMPLWLWFWLVSRRQRTKAAQLREAMAVRALDSAESVESNQQTAE